MDGQPRNRSIDGIPKPKDFSATREQPSENIFTTYQLPYFAASPPFTPMHTLAPTLVTSSEERIVLHAVTPSALIHKLVVQDIDVEGDGMSGRVVQRKIFKWVCT
ncbi:MAG: hypothetical protein LQ346_002154 [Caloplaca aetnensis]|nr:MAG: hypothetical protein LQ346_002154 [Caloplaca aetnensis]